MDALVPGVTFIDGQLGGRGPRFLDEELASQPVRRAIVAILADGQPSAGHLIGVEILHASRLLRPEDLLD
ncbi:hypothetical protein N8K70_02820 [Microbacterium betulae]|uniref:Uncharacterized protein n=1 Tax=Microbacterium betulae TaxID=2981139 RepID=A0AA97FJV2_9MICO|nr:hypothetical protein [Microbacterium sp. AB]WOF23630.1 hypothetical protein N8K70_02820 [Microbacterium sp. AB]